MTIIRSEGHGGAKKIKCLNVEKKKSVLCKMAAQFQWRKNFSDQITRKKVTVFFVCKKNAGSGFQICPLKRFLRRRDAASQHKVTPYHIRRSDRNETFKVFL